MVLCIHHKRIEDGDKRRQSIKSINIVHTYEPFYVFSMDFVTFFDGLPTKLSPNFKKKHDQKKKKTQKNSTSMTN